MILEAFQGAADGVLVVGCHFGECHYESGNYQVDSRIEITKRLLSQLGFDRTRVAFRQCSSAEGLKFAATVDEFDRTIRQLGPLGRPEGLDQGATQDRLALSMEVVKGPKLRWVLGKAVEFQRTGNKYGEVFTRHELMRCLDGIILDELTVHGILRELGESPRSVAELAAVIGLPPFRVVRYLEALRRRQVVHVAEVQGTTPYFSPTPKETG